MLPRTETLSLLPMCKVTHHPLIIVIFFSMNDVTHAVPLLTSILYDFTRPVLYCFEMIYVLGVVLVWICYFKMSCWSSKACLARPDSNPLAPCSFLLRQPSLPTQPR